MMKKNHGICQVSIAPVRKSPTDESEIVTQLLFGDYVELREKGEPWIKVFFPADNYEGWMDFKQLHYISEQDFQAGVHQLHEVVKTGLLKIKGPIGIQHIIFGSNLPFLEDNFFKIGEIKCEILADIPAFNESLVSTALRYENTPYLWGGKGILGIDCSGFIQIVAKVHGVSMPRDASQQVNIGINVAFSGRKAGDLMYFINAKGKVHHVGVLIDDKKIIHAAGHVRIDDYNEEGIYRSDFGKLTHFFHSIRRI